MSPSVLVYASTASIVTSAMATTDAPSFATATEVLEAITTGGEALDALRAYLSTHDVEDYRFEVEAWAGVCGGALDQAEQCAFDARMALVEQFTDVAVATPLPPWADRTLPELLVGSSHRTSYAAFGDEYIAAMIKVQLPANATVCVPRGLPAYSKAAEIFKETVNDIVRPLLKTSLKRKLIEASWDTGGDESLLVAAVVTLREMIRAPELFIDSDGAAADPNQPCIYIRRGVIGDKSAGAVGVLYQRELRVVERPIDAIALWLIMARDGNDAVDAIMDALEMRDTRSSTAKSILSGRTAIAKAKADALANAL